MRLLNAVYSRDKQESFIRRALDEAQRILSGMTLSVDELEKFWMMVAAALEPLFILFKAPAFREEKEWRLVSADYVPQVKFRPSGRGVVPYFELRLKESAIKSVVCGPHFSLSGMRGVEYMLRCHGISATVSRSQIPLSQ
jgi:hypothetical protein